VCVAVHQRSVTEKMRVLHGAICSETVDVYQRQLCMIR
jgi:hypothetical protein